MVRLTELQKRRVKELVDEMTVGRGMIELLHPDHLVDGISNEDLSKIAFRYYRMLYSGERVIVPEGSREWYRCTYCPDKCQEYIRLNPDNPTSGYNTPGHCPKGDNYMPSLECLTCGVVFEGDKSSDSPEPFVP
ncbi:MAG: hypothetical protein HY709_03545, partial [Candidatus Latescibacteria bacterium]|nr:hypothetical protein [Candidatus Latescibacterota bacterium]